MLYVLSRTDRLFPPELAPVVMHGLKTAGVDADYFLLDSDYGHSASGRDAHKWAPRLREFMESLVLVSIRLGGERNATKQSILLFVAYGLLRWRSQCCG